MKINYLEIDIESLVDGDLIQTKNELLLIVTLKGSLPGYELISLTNSEIYDHTTFGHPLHILNHLKKHYKDGFSIIKANKVELNIKG